MSLSDADRDAYPPPLSTTPMPSRPTTTQLAQPPPAESVRRGPERRSLAPTTVRHEIARRSLIWIAIVLASAWLLVQLWTVVLVVVVALFIAVTLAPLVTWFERVGVSRGWALLLIFLGMLVVLAGLLFITLPPLVTELLKILEDGPHQRARLIAYLSEYKVTASLAKSINSVPLDAVFASAGNTLLGYSSQLLTFIGYALTTMFLGFYLLIDAKQANGALYALVPRRYHLRLARILLNFEVIVGGYIRGQIITSLAITLFVFGVLTLLGVPNALALAIFAGLTDVVPFVGGMIATLPVVAAALVKGVPTAAIVFAVLLVYQEFESRILVPRIYGRVLRLPTAVVLLSLLIGGTLMGILGALIALPIASGLLMIMRELRVELPGDDTDGSQVRARDARAERVYEHLTAGAPAKEAARIALEMAERIQHNEAAHLVVQRAETVETPVVVIPPEARLTGGPGTPPRTPPDRAPED